MLTRKGLATLGGLLLIVLVACGTRESDQVTATSARFNSVGECHQYRGAWDHGYYRQAYKAKELVNGSFVGAQPWQRFDCTQQGGPWDLRVVVGGMAQDTTYQSRLEIQWDPYTDSSGYHPSEFAWYDSTDTKNGTNYTLTTTDADSGGLGGQVYPRGGAIPAVNVERCLDWKMTTHYGMGSGNASTTRGQLYRRCGRDITMLCEITLSVHGGKTIDNVTDTDFHFYPETPCATAASSSKTNPCRPFRNCVGATFEFQAMLENEDLQWHNRFDKYPNEGCHVYDDAFGRSVLECLHHQGGR